MRAIILENASELLPAMGPERDVHGTTRPRVQQCTVRQFVKGRWQQLEHKRSAPGARPGCVVSCGRSMGSYGYRRFRKRSRQRFTSP
jgi:hypothetical protein